jgi:hypothetical protein
MKPTFVIALLFLVVRSWAGDVVGTYGGVELKLDSVMRAKAFRDLTVKNERKHDLAIIKLAIVWTPEKRTLLIDDSDLRLSDVKGKKHKCALKFVQALAPQDLSTTLVEIPFRVDADVELKELRIGNAILDLTPASTQDGSAQALPAVPRP